MPNVKKTLKNGNGVYFNVIIGKTLHGRKQSQRCPKVRFDAEKEQWRLLHRFPHLICEYRRVLPIQKCYELQIRSFPVGYG